MPNLVILTGAGISAESGIATFRDANGLWRPVCRDRRGSGNHRGARVDEEVTFFEKKVTKKTWGWPR